MSRLVLVLGDQCSQRLSALAAADKARDVVVMAEVVSEATYVPHHPKKIAFIFSVMRHFAEDLRAQGWRVAYTTLDDPDTAGSIPAELLRRAAEFGATEVLATEPGEHRLIAALTDTPLRLTLLPDDRFLASHQRFATWAEGRKQLRMEYFYREMRRETGLLMAGDAPEGGKWNYDAQNRKPAKADLFRPDPLRFEPDAITTEVLDLVEARFAGNFGRLRPFWFAVTPDQAEASLSHWIAQALPLFGDYQDAMLVGERFLYHALISHYINVGLLDPLHVCQRVEAAYHAGQAPLNAAEGFIRQIIGWREYVRGIYFLEGPDYTRRNVLGHDRPLPPSFWGAETDMRCISQVVGQVRDEAYAHHIQRLMITGNFALLAGVDPALVHGWYLAVFVDAFEWVEAPNVIGMSQFADGGIVASKPYVSSGAYVKRMSDYCQGCRYKVTERVGPDACPFNALYWGFLDRHRERFSMNPRMGQMYRSWERMDPRARSETLAQAEDLLGRLDTL